MVPLIALKAKACKISGHSQAWSHMAANEDVFMGRSKNKKAPDHSIRGCRSREAFFVDAAACQETCRNAESVSGERMISDLKNLCQVGTNNFRYGHTQP